MIYEYLDRIKRPATREELKNHFNFSDRNIRDQIAKEREAGKIIINKQDGKGYYVKNSSADTAVQLKLTVARIVKLNRCRMALVRAFKLEKRREQGKPIIVEMELF